MRRSTKKTLFISITAGLCVSFLAACDGRGVTPLQGVKYTKAQMEAYNASLKKSGQPQNDTHTIPDPGQNTGADSGAAGGQDSQAVPESDLFANPTQTVAAGEQQTSGGASSKTFKVIERNHGVDVAKQALAKGADAKAVEMVKGLTLGGIQAGNPALLTLDAVLSIQGQPVALSIKDAPVTFNDNAAPLVDGAVTTLADKTQVQASVSLRSTDGTVTPLTQDYRALYVIPFCGDEKCQTVYVLMDGFNTNARAMAVFEFQQDSKSGAYTLVNDNLGKVPDSFDAANAQYMVAANPAAQKPEPKPAQDDAKAAVQQQQQPQQQAQQQPVIDDRAQAIADKRESDAFAASRAATTTVTPSQQQPAMIDDRAQAVADKREAEAFAASRSSTATTPATSSDDRSQAIADKREAEAFAASRNDERAQAVQDKLMIKALSTNTTGAASK